LGKCAIRGHPYVLKEIEATQEKNDDKALRDFDAAFFGHMAFVISNKARRRWMASPARVSRLHRAMGIRALLSAV
jgi:acyl-CoA dehydrogenase